MLWLAFTGILTSGVVFSLGGLHFAIERAYGLLLIGVLAYRLLGPCVPPVRPLLWVWTSWLMVLGVAAVASGQFAAHTPALLIAIVPVAYFAMIAGHGVDGARVDRIVRACLWLYGALGAASLLAFRAIGSARPLFGMVDELGRLKLGVVEPNLLGSTMGFLILLSLPRARFDQRRLLMYALALVALLGSLSKGPVLAFGIGVFVYVMLRAIARRADLSVAVVLPLWIGALGGAVLLAALPSLTNVYDTYLARDDAIFSRSYFLRLAISRYWASPLIGRGPGDFGLQSKAVLWAVGGQGINNLWISQMFVNILHDSGVVGLLIYGLFLVLLIRRGYERVRAGSIDHGGYLAAFVSLLIASQASTVHLNAIFGVAAGLVAAVPVAIRSGTRTATAPTLSRRAAMAGRL